MPSGKKRASLREQPGEEIVEVSFREEAAESGRHEGEAGRFLRKDGILRETVGPTGGIDDVEDLSTLAAEEARGGGAVLELKGIEIEVRIDVTIWVEDVLAKPGDATLSDSIELRTEQSALPRHLVTECAVRGKEHGTVLGVGLGRGIRCGTRCDECVEVLPSFLRNWHGRRGKGSGQEGTEAVAQVGGGGDLEKGGKLAKGLGAGGGVEERSDADEGGFDPRHRQPSVGRTTVPVDDLKLHGLTFHSGEIPRHPHAGIVAGREGAAEFLLRFGMDEADAIILVGGLAGHSAVTANPEGEGLRGRERLAA